jgi:hypothetical protein
LPKPKRSCKKKPRVKDDTKIKQVLAEKGDSSKHLCGHPSVQQKKRRNQRNHTVKPFQKEEPNDNCVYCGQKAKEIAKLQSHNNLAFTMLTLHVF